MRRLVIAFALGVAAVAVIEVVAIVALVVAGDVYGWPSFSVGNGPLLLVEVERTHRESAATIGAGVAVVAGFGGLLNAGGAALVARRH